MSNIGENCRVWVSSTDPTTPSAPTTPSGEPIDPLSTKCWLGEPLQHTGTCQGTLNHGTGFSGERGSDKLRLVLCQSKEEEYKVFNTHPFDKIFFTDIFGALFPSQAHLTKDFCEPRPHVTRLIIDNFKTGILLITSGQAVEMCGVALCYNSNTHLTRAIVHCRNFAGILKFLEGTANLADNPLLLPLIIASQVIGTCSHNIYGPGGHMYTLTEVIESETGQNDYKFAKKVNRLTINFGKVTKDTNMLLTNLEWTKIKLNYLSTLHLCIRDILEKKCAIALEGKPDQIRNLLEYQDSIVQNLLLCVESIRERAKNELDVIYNFAAQRDTSIVNAIGIVTFLFFPGTFLASVLSMPLIDWESNSAKPRLHKQFWFFPVITLSFTATIIIVLYPWIWRSNIIPKQKKTSPLSTKHPPKNTEKRVIVWLKKAFGFPTTRPPPSPTGQT